MLLAITAHLDEHTHLFMSAVRLSVRCWHTCTRSLTCFCARSSVLVTSLRRPSSAPFSSARCARSSLSSRLLGGGNSTRQHTHTMQCLRCVLTAGAQHLVVFLVSADLTTLLHHLRYQSCRAGHPPTTTHTHPVPPCPSGPLLCAVPGGELGLSGAQVTLQAHQAGLLFVQLLVGTTKQAWLTGVKAWTHDGRRRSLRDAHTQQSC